MQQRRSFIHPILAVWALAGLLPPQMAEADTEKDTALVYSAFTGDGEDGLHLLTSLDGRKWDTVKGYASLYQQSSGLMRDPSICVGGDGKFHMVWTTGWWNDTIGIAHSGDLVEWTPMQSLHIWADYQGPGGEESDGTRWPKDLTQAAPRNPKVRNCWAPEIFYDDDTKEYVIFWATTIDDPKVFPKTWDARRWERMNQRIYFITTKDFRTYTPRKFFYATEDRVVIDACICKTGKGEYRMIIKDELAQRLHTVFPAKKLESWAKMPRDFWGPMSEQAFTGPACSPTTPTPKARVSCGSAMSGWCTATTGWPTRTGCSRPRTSRR